MLSSQVTDKVDLGWTVVEIRKLSARSMRKAGEQRQISWAQAVKRLGDAVSAFGDKTDKSDAEKKAEAKKRTPEQLDAARYDAYDRETVLDKGVTGGLAEPLAASIAELDLEDEDKVFKAIVDLSAPRKADAEAAEKNA